jgi:hypothetical protein
MELKNAVSVCLISLFSASLVVLVARTLDLQAASKIEPQLASIVEELRAIRGQGGLALDPSAAAAPATTQDSTMVYYFHSSFRCQTCRDLETQAHEVVRSDFADRLATGAVQWQTINYDQGPGKEMAKQFDISMPMVVVARIEGGKMTRWKSLDRIWALLEDKQAYAAFVRNEIQQMLGPAASAAAVLPGDDPLPVLAAPQPAQHDESQASLVIPVPGSDELPSPE